MQVAVSLFVGLIVGVVLYLVTRRQANLAMWIALVLGVVAAVLLVGSINGWLLPDAGRFGAIGMGLLSGIATILAVGCIARGERKPLNWVALFVSALPVLFLIVFGLGELLGPPH